jgi:geranylgeranyl diphosphate synthase, type I
MAKTTLIKSDLEAFKFKLQGYKKIIDDDISTYSKHVQELTSEQYGENARLETDAFVEILGRGGKRIRGALTILGYEMSGGKGQGMILQAARAIEMLHAYILIIDDIQDRSLTRRGGPAAHKALSDYHKAQNLGGDADNFGLSIALNAAVAGAHAAQMILANLNAPENLRLNALSIINRTMVITAHGQTSDIMHEAAGKVTMADIEQVMTWKTSQYSILNPIHVGMVLAGADCQATDAITEYAMNIGKAYQITDDILDTFGTEDPMDDIRGGKQTVLTIYALENAKTTDQKFLKSMLGNGGLTMAEFMRCKQILVDCGALQYAKSTTQKYIDQAISSLNKDSTHWTQEGTHFLRGLAEYILLRTV